jgi:hypothetical protein
MAKTLFSLCRAKSRNGVANGFLEAFRARVANRALGAIGAFSSPLAKCENVGPTRPAATKNAWPPAPWAG